MDQNTFNHDKFNTWEKCKKRYFFKYVQELKWPEFDNNYKLGKSIHALIDYHLRGLKIDHLLKNLDEETKTHWEALLKHPILKNEVIITEWSFNSRTGNSKYWLNGRIDAVFHDKQENKYIIVDWKTGQNIPKNQENDFQSMLYLYSFFNAHKDLKLDLKPENLVFQYIKTPDLETPACIAYSTEKEKEYENIFLNIIKNIENEEIFEKTVPCKLNKNCQYKTCCDKLN